MICSDGQDEKKVRLCKLQTEELINFWHIEEKKKNKH